MVQTETLLQDLNNGGYFLLSAASVAIPTTVLACSTPYAPRKAPYAFLDKTSYSVGTSKCIFQDANLKNITLAYHYLVPI